jgi:hypothetical protein
MKCLLVGYPGSLIIRKASKYLTRKYLFELDVKYICHKGSKESWSRFVASCLQQLPDDYVIMALDDYLLNSRLKKSVVKDIVALMRLKKAVVTKLCKSTPQENEEYPVTTQYCIWNKGYLLNLLKKTTTPWDFEVKGSRIFREEGQVFMHFPFLRYHANSSLSARWEGVNLEGVREEDINIVKGYL